MLFTIIKRILRFGQIKPQNSICQKVRSHGKSVSVFATPFLNVDVIYEQAFISSDCGNQLLFIADGFPFDFVFIIRLRKVDKDISLAQVIIDQHEELDGDDREYVEALLGPEKLSRRYYCYWTGMMSTQPRTNKALDKAIESGVGNCFTILTSRPGTDSGDKTYYVSQRNQR